jgi:hypothetical protein
MVTEKPALAKIPIVDDDSAVRAAIILLRERAANDVAASR